MVHSKSAVFIAVCAVAWYVLPSVVSGAASVAVALLTFLALAAGQSVMEMSQIAHSSLLSPAAAAFYYGRHGSNPSSSFAAKLLHVGFRPDAIRRVPPSAYLHASYGLDKSVADELGTLVNIVVADFVTFWYKSFTSDDLFGSSVKLVLCDILGGLCIRIQRTFDLHGTLSTATEGLQVVQLHLAWFRELYAELCEKHPHAFGDDSDASLARRRRLVLDAVAAHEPPKLHHGAIDTPDYLKQLSTQLLAVLRPDFDDRCNIQRSFVSFSYMAWHFTSEILARCVLGPLVAYCNPEHLNPLVTSLLAPFHVRELELDTKAKRPLNSYTASRATCCTYDDDQLVSQLVSLMEELDSPESGPQLLPLAPAVEVSGTSGIVATDKPPLPLKPKHRKTRSILDVSATMKARFSKRRTSRATSDRSTSSMSALDVTELSKCSDIGSEIAPSHLQPSIGRDIVQQVDHAIRLYLALDPKLLLSSGRTRELHGLVSSLEEVLLFGYNGADPASPTTAASPTLPTVDESYWTYLRQRRAQTSFWNDRVKLVQSLPAPRASDGHFSPRGVQWLLLALEEGELWEYFTAMAVDASVTNVFYEPYAVLRDKELRSDLLASLFRLNGFRITLHLQTLGHDRLTLSNNLQTIENHPFGVTCVVEEAWESERYLPLQGWTKSSDKRKRDDERLPTSEWVWDGPWTLEGHPEADTDGGDSDDNASPLGRDPPARDNNRGWLYSKTSKNVGFHAKESRLDCVRRRKWLRHRKTLPFVIVPVSHLLHDGSVDQSASSNQDKEKPTTSSRRLADVSPVQSTAQGTACCRLCRRSVEGASTCLTCPRCSEMACFSCSNQCVMDESAKQVRVCATCYETHAAQLRLRLTARATRVPEAATVLFDIHVTSGDGLAWTGRKTKAEIDALVALVTCHQPDAGTATSTVRSLQARMHPHESDESAVNRVLDYILKDGTLCQSPDVQQFLLDLASGSPAAGTKADLLSKLRHQSARQGQVLLQKLEIHAFKVMDEMFELDDMSRMRRRLLSVTRTFIRVSFNATCHRIVEAQFGEWTHPKRIASALCDLRAAAIPTDGVYVRHSAPATPTTILNQARQCRSALLRSCPPAFVSLLGERSTRHGCLKLFEFLQHEVIVKNLVFSLIDVVLHRVFPDLAVLKAKKRSGASARQT
ncbi:hypothetical protein, variant [Aphanomyces invadans]|uniref:RUN domain-containing protein n=1 Tax=Aphanomyces invadans TaxID=157072 RepID=A0A024U2P9_9STRA|nr:hypothetical protein, variant [Aphanomyces invadans]ETW00480.1 hypothetical protein, variant [Aphanomyces invadans]|eukprot:XP_008870615.1 hypothetical protein, variant [Aphanomyces invadans]